MEIIKRDYKNGLLWFILLSLLIASLFPVPDGDILQYKFLGLFGISPIIPSGKNSGLYIYSIITLVFIYISIKRVLKYWQSYGRKFQSLHKVLRILPLILISALFVLNININNVYYGVKGLLGGLKSVACYQLPDKEYDLFTFECDLGLVTFQYDFIFENYSNEEVSFQIKVVNRYFDPERLGYVVPPEVFIKDPEGGIKMVTLLPKQRARITGEFTEAEKTGDISRGFITPDIILINTGEQYSPKLIPKLPNTNSNFKRN